MIDGPTAAVILGVLGTIATAVIKFVPSRGGSNGQEASVAALRQQVADMERRISKNETNIDKQADAFTRWLREQQ